MHSMIQCMRWFGHHDTVSLPEIKQAGCEGVVSALHQFKPGEIWPYEAISKFKRYIESFGLSWEVVESLPVHDHIKLGYPDRDVLIDHYIESLKNLSRAGVYIVTYNFMPLLDWLRTDVAYKREDGTEILYYKKLDYQAFDIHILERENANKDYSAEELDRIADHYNSLTEEYKEKLKNNFLLALPGDTQNFNLEYIREKTKEYGKVSKEKMKENLLYFLNRICPVADQCNMKMAIHPDDPPFSVFGLPRIVSTADDCKFLLEGANYNSNGLCFCTGSFGARADNDLVNMIQAFGNKIHFLHLRNTKRLENGDFYEANHLEGDANFYQIVKAILDIIHQENRRIPMRPDHGAKMLDDLNKKCYPGYSAIGRLKGLAEIRGLEYGLIALTNK
jgi:mannonate dehydratase